MELRWLKLYLLRVLFDIDNMRSKVSHQNQEAASSQLIDLSFFEPEVLQGPRNLAKRVKKNHSSESKELIVTHQPSLDMYDIPATGQDVMCDKCKRVIPKGMPYYKFIYSDRFGTMHSTRSHKICFDINPERELS